MISQAILLCIVSVVVTKAYVVPGYANSAYEPDYEAKPEPYSFGFDTKDEYGSTLTRKEEGDELGNKRGSYSYVDPYGIYRQVDYVADEKGFRAVVKTNEPGTDSQNPADTEMLSEAAPVKYDAPASYARPAPVYATPSPAPVAPAAPLAPLAPAAPLSQGYGEQAPSVYAPAPAAYSPAPQVYSPAPSVYDAPAPSVYDAPSSSVYDAPSSNVYDAPSSSVYDSPSPSVYAAPAGYGAAPVYEQLSSQSYAGPSYEQLVDKANQNTESRKQQYE